MPGASSSRRYSTRQQSVRKGYRSLFVVVSHIQRVLVANPKTVLIMLRYPVVSICVGGLLKLLLYTKS